MHALSVLAVASALAALPAQVSTTSVNDVGLTMQIGTPTGPVAAIAGQVCGPFTCTPFPSGSVTSPVISNVRTVRVYGDANSLYVLAMSTGPVAQPCVPIPGIGNALILGQPMMLLTFGVTGPLLPSPSIACRQGVGTYQLVLPIVAPSVIPFRLQALTFSFTTQGPAFTVAIQGYAH
jgi:hypothetical protein